MSLLGFEYRDAAYVPDADFLDRRYGLVDPRIASERGYAPIDLGVAGPMEYLPPDPEEQRAYLEALRGEERTIDLVNTADGTVLGTATIFGGCVGDANTAVFGSSDAYLAHMADDAAVQLMAQEAWVRAREGGAVQTATRAWSICMNERGYDFADPFEVFEIDWPEPRPSDDEVATASADVECKQETGYTAAFTEAEATEQTTLLDVSALDADGFQRRQAIVVQTAIEIAQG